MLAITVQSIRYILYRMLLSASCCVHSKVMKDPSVRPHSGLLLFAPICSTCSGLYQWFGLHTYAAPQLARDQNCLLSIYTHSLHQVEALHLWRRCAEYGAFFMHMDDGFGAICQLFSSPPSAELQPNEADASKATASKAALLQQLKLQASCQVYLLLTALVHHGMR